MATHAINQTDYAFARTHEQHAVPDPCQRVCESDATGENVTLCGLDCWVTCPVCQLDACSERCLRAMQCGHEIKSL